MGDSENVLNLDLGNGNRHGNFWKNSLCCTHENFVLCLYLFVCLFQNSIPNNLQKSPMWFLYVARIQSTVVLYQATMSARVLLSYSHPAVSLDNTSRHVIPCSYKTTHAISKRPKEKALSASFKIPSKAMTFINSAFLYSAIANGS